MHEVLTKAVEQATRFRGEFVQSECQTADDLIALAIAMVQQAEIIFMELGGPTMALAQFQAITDRIDPLKRRT